MANYFLFEDTQFFDNNGNPLNGGKLYSYAAGTSTPLATFTDSTGGVQNSNPLILDSSGRGQMWLSASGYKFLIKNSADALIATIDNYSPSNLDTTVSQLTDTGNLTLQQSAAATAGANQSSNQVKIQGSYWNGSASAVDQWTLQDTLGAGANPSSTLTAAHSGSSGASALSVQAALSGQNQASGNLGVKYGSTDGYVYVSSTGSDANDGLSPGSAKLTLQAAINALPSNGGTIQVVGTIAANSALTLKSNVNIIGLGSAQVDAVTGPSTITTTLGAGDLFYFNGFNDCRMCDLSIKNTGSAGANAGIRLTAAQRNTFERIYISGPFARGVQLDSSSVAAASCIWNRFKDIHTTGLAANGIGLLLDSGNASAKVINGNYFDNFRASGGSSGVGIKLTNSGVFNQVINENVFQASEVTALNGTGLLVDQGSTRGNVFIDCNIEGCTTGVNKATTNTLTFLGGNISSNTTNVTDAQPAFTILLGTNVGGTVQQLAINAAGGIYADGLGIGGGSPNNNALNGSAGWKMQVASGDVAQVNAATFQLKQNAIFDAGKTITQIGQGATVGNGVAATYGQDDKTGQSASIGSTTLITGTATSGGHYSVCYQLATTTSDASGASVTLTVGWTSDSVARTNLSGSVALAATANGTALCVPLHADNSTNITYSTTVTGVPTTGRYAVHVWVSKQ